MHVWWAARHKQGGKVWLVNNHNCIAEQQEAISHPKSVSRVKFWMNLSCTMNMVAQKSVIVVHTYMEITSALKLMYI